MRPGESVLPASHATVNRPLSTPGWGQNTAELGSRGADKTVSDSAGTRSTCVAGPRLACRSQGFSERVAAITATPQRSSTGSQYDQVWTSFCTWLESSGGANPFEAFAPQVAEYLLSVHDLGRSISTVKVHKSPTCVTIRKGGGPNHSEHPTIQAFIKSLALLLLPAERCNAKMGSEYCVESVVCSSVRNVGQADLNHLS